MKTKKASLKNFISILLAVIGLTILFFGVTNLYAASTANQESKSAQAFANLLQTKLNAAIDEEARGVELSFQGYKTKDDWFIAGWGKDTEGRPDSCFFNSCVCVCQNDCSQRDGFCREINADDLSLNSFSANTGIAGSKVSSHIIIEPKLMELEATFSEGFLTVNHYQEGYSGTLGPGGSGEFRGSGFEGEL